MADESGIWVPPGGSADPRREQPTHRSRTAGRLADEISPEELAEQLRRLRVSDVVLSLLPALAQLATQAGPEVRDLGEARVAIDAMSALLPVLGARCPGADPRATGQLVQLQLAYARRPRLPQRGACRPGPSHTAQSRRRAQERFGR